MEYGSADRRIVNPSSGGDGKWAGCQDRSSNLPQATQHLVILASSQSPPEDKHSLCNRTMALPQVSPDPLWPLSLVCHLSIWPAQFTIYTWSWDQASGGQGHKLKQSPQKIQFVPMPLKQTPKGSFPEFWSTSSPSPDMRTLVLPMLTRSPFPSLLIFQRISSSSNSVMMTNSSTGFRMGILCENLGRGIQEPWWTVEGSGRSLGEYPLSHLTLHSGCKPTRTLLLASSYMLCISCTSHSSKPILRRAHQTTYLGTRSNAFSISTKTMYSVLYKLYVIGAHLMSQKDLSRPFSLETWWPGLAIWGLDNFLAQERRWYSPPNL